MQHVVIECARIRDLLMVLKAALSSSSGDVMMPFRLTSWDLFICLVLSVHLGSVPEWITTGRP